MRKRLRIHNRILLAMVIAGILSINFAARYEMEGLMYLATILFLVAFVWNKRLSVARSIYRHELIRELAREDIRNHRVGLWL